MEAIKLDITFGNRELCDYLRDGSIVSDAAVSIEDPRVLVNVRNVAGINDTKYFGLEVEGEAGDKFYVDVEGYESAELDEANLELLIHKSNSKVTFRIVDMMSFADLKRELTEWTEAEGGEDSEERAFSEGYKAYKVKGAKCPYKRGTKESDAWVDGWQEAEMDFESY